ncbi:hypothetical protein [Paraglaciecola sp.]|uniref:hypothetical protein n=1 Tax=Paraglaciecola sp. TaxID=1920173 RepID=UPI00273F0D0F|nr:hypothetical protein [Paraglaciecola sp.]MDP5031694.1 hypothetical protein [Paraglaciecola sp.]
MELSKIAIAVSSVCLLAGCFEVEDNSNDELVAALQEQNQILQEQQYQTNTVAIRGVVVDALEQSPVTSATITVKIGVEIVASDIQTTNGEFVVSKLPANSDVEVIVSSPDNAFLTRAFFYDTGSSTSGEAQKDFGAFVVSEGMEVSISVLDSETNAPLSNLVFEGNSSEGTGSSYRNYLHTSSFNETTGAYLVTIPKYLSVGLYASVDSDKDGEPDYVPELNQYDNGTNLYVSWSNAKENPTIYVAQSTGEEIDTTPIQFRIAVVDSLGDSIEGADVTFTDNETEALQASYDSDNTQYVINTDFLFNGNIQIPAFSANGVNYQSASINIYKQSDGSLYITQSANTSASFNVPQDDIIELAIQPRTLTNADSTLEVVFKSEVNTTNSNFSVFYSQPVNVSNDAITLYSSQAFTVTRGNDNANDLVLPGVTLIASGQNTTVTSTQSLNNTKLSISPTEDLIGGMTYQYSVGLIEVESSQVEVDINGDEISFVAPYSVLEAFDINDVRLDNDNYTTNGVLINASNTAGEASTANDRDNNVYIILPKSVNNLQNLTMRKMIVVDDGVSRNDTNTFNLVDNGQLNNLSKSASVSLAENETIVRDGNYTNIKNGLSLADEQQIFFTYTYEYMSDNLSDSENSITYEYAYETKEGEVVTGTITLPVN